MITDKVKLGIIGLGKRGASMVHEIFCNLEDVKIVAFSDVYEDKMQDAYEQRKDKIGEKPLFFTNYRDMLNKDLVDAVYIASSWESHTKIAIDAMDSNIITAMEVGGAYSVHECWELVKTYEKTKTPFMFMENCCYGK